MEGPLPPLTKIDDDVEGVEVEVMLALKSMRYGRPPEEGSLARIVRYVTGTWESRFTGRILLLVQC